MSDVAKSKELLKRYSIARIPFIAINTIERARTLDILKEISEELSLPFYVHTLSKGIYDLSTEKIISDDKSYLQGCHKEKPPEKDGFNYSRYSPRPEGGSLGYSSSSKLSNGPLRPERWSLVYSTFSSTPFSISFLACAEGRAA